MSPPHLLPPVAPAQPSANVVNSAANAEQPLYTTSKDIIDDALSSLSTATGSGKILDKWLRVFTPLMMFVLTLLTVDQTPQTVSPIWNPRGTVVYSCIEEVLSGLDGLVKSQPFPFIGSKGWIIRTPLNPGNSMFVSSGCITFQRRRQT